MPACPNGSFPYTLKHGDNLWMLAKRFRTTIQSIMAVNPGIDPHRLMIGQTICIPKYHQMPPHICITKSQEALKNYLNLLWGQHVMWTRMAIIAIAQDSPDKDLVVQRLLRNPTDFEHALTPLYGQEKAAQFSKLFRDHLVIAANLVSSAKKGDTDAAAQYEKQWYQNADQIAAYLNSINPYWSKETFTNMLHEHLAMTKSEAVYRLSKDYASDIAIFDQIELQALAMANAMAEGIIKQFPDKFKD